MSASENRVASIGSLLFQSTGGNGVYARTGLFEQVMEALSALITRERQADTEVLRQRENERPYGPRLSDESDLTI